MQLTLKPARILAKHITRVTAADLKAGAYNDLIDSMQKDMVANNGIGLAANQVGKDVAIFVIDAQLAADNEVPSVYANPEITEYGREHDDVEEGCLSIPGFWTPIRRSKKIMFKALDRDGKRLKFRARGMLARVLQHETDHLNGTTISERASSSQTTP
jgi:peptide deformylase